MGERKSLTNLILFFAALVGVSGVHINVLSVPHEVKNGTEEAVVLDCDYVVQDSERPGFVLKWFFNKVVVYQWIYSKRPQDLGILRGRLNLDYKVSEDEHESFRALQIMKPTTELSGEYLCKVSTFEGEALRASRMIVYAPEKEMDIVVERKGGEDPTVNLSCFAHGVYPEPKLTLFLDVNNEVTKIEDVVAESVESGGAYDVRVYKVMDARDVVSPAVFSCELKIPNTSYVIRRESFYQRLVDANDDGGVNGGNRTGLCFVLLFLLGLLTTT